MTKKMINFVIDYLFLHTYSPSHYELPFPLFFFKMEKYARKNDNDLCNRSTHRN